MPAGRPPIPTALKLVSGNPGKRPLSEKEPAPAASPSQAPKDLGGDALACWKRLFPILTNMGVMTVADREALAETCRCYGELSAARRSLAQPLLAPDPDDPAKLIEVAAAGDAVFRTLSRDGVPVKPRPELAIIEAAARRYRDYLIQFGLTPAARSRVQVVEAKAVSRAASYFS